MLGGLMRSFFREGENSNGQKPRKRRENEFFPNVGIVIYGSKSLCFSRGVRKLFVLPRNTGFFEGSFFRGGEVVFGVQGSGMNNNVFDEDRLLFFLG
jgi:hypothetical protein